METFIKPSSSSSLSSFPRLEILAPSNPHIFTVPTKRINQGTDLARFHASKAYRDIGIFLMQLNRAICPRKNPAGPSTTFPLVGADRRDPDSVKRLQRLLEKTAEIIDEAPPNPGPRRFGNVSFRKWYELLEQRVDVLMKEYVGPDVLGFSAEQEQDTDDNAVGAIDELRAYFLGGFGSPQRLDYGTGHELSFLAFLGCLWKLGAFQDGGQADAVERSIVLGVFEQYLKVVRRLILTYTLEPAGSHGVWGLDDHSFMPYIFGSAQLTRPITENEAMPLEGSVERAPKPGDVVKSDAVERLREVNMYFSAIGFINDVKKGPFWEHSPILYDVSGITAGWGKINKASKGMIKMFDAEVLSKFPVVQHFPFGSLFSWEANPDASPPRQTVHSANQPGATAGISATTTVSSPMPEATTAPWAQRAANVPPQTGYPSSRAPLAPAPGASTSETSGPDLERIEPLQPTGPRGTTGAQFSITKAPWAK